MTQWIKLLPTKPEDLCLSPRTYTVEEEKLSSHVYIQTVFHAHMSMYKCSHTHMHTLTHAHSHMHMSVRMHTHMHILTHAHSHMHTP